MSVNTPISNISTKSQDNLVSYFQSCVTNLNTSWNVRERMKRIDLSYNREVDFTTENYEAKKANKAGDPTKFRNQVVPVVLPAVESAVTYQASVFLTGIPLFGVSASASYSDAALQMESIIDDQATKGGWIRQLQLFLRDGFKYNIAAVEVEWTRKKIYSPTTDVAFSHSQAKPLETYWEGNTLKRLDPYNILFDARVPPAEMSVHGEFAGYNDILSRIELIRYLQSLSFRLNYKKALETGTPSTANDASVNSYYLPRINPEAILDQSQYTGTNWFKWAGIDQKRGAVDYKSAYLLTTFYARIIPRDFELASPVAGSPQIWKFIFVNSQTLVYAERQTNAHDLLPILFAQPLEDGLGYQTKSLAQNSEAFQAVATALVNSAIQARRRSVGDRGVYDPSMIDKKNIESDSATAKVPLRPSAYGKGTAGAYTPIPFRDDQSATAMSDVQAILKFNEMVIGQNPAQQGQFVKGNRTLNEYQDVMSNANGRSQNISVLLESQFFTPLKEILKLNILQYQPPTEVFNREIESTVVIDPVKLRQAVLEFKMSDGLTPASKQMNTDAFAAATQVIAQVPALAQAYNLGPMFSYLFKSQRAEVGQFEKPPTQIQYEQAVAQWQQAVQQLVLVLSKQNMSPEDIKKAIPPQPTPQQFGFDPNAGTAKTAAQSDKTVLQNFTEASQPPQPPQPPAQSGAQQNAS